MVIGMGFWWKYWYFERPGMVYFVVFIPYVIDYYDAVYCFCFFVLRPLVNNGRPWTGFKDIGADWLLIGSVSLFWALCFVTSYLSTLKFIITVEVEKCFDNCLGSQFLSALGNPLLPITPEFPPFWLLSFPRYWFFNLFLTCVLFLPLFQFPFWLLRFLTI